MDPELRGYLEALEERVSRRIDAVQAVAESGVRAAESADRTAAAALSAAAAAVKAAESAGHAAETAGHAAETARQEARVLHEATLQAVRAVAEGQVALREQIDRRFDDYHRELMDRHILPVEAVVRSLSVRVADHTVRITDLEGRG